MRTPEMTCARWLYARCQKEWMHLKPCSRLRGGNWRHENSRPGLPTKSFYGLNASPWNNVQAKRQQRTRPTS